MSAPLFAGFFACVGGLTNIIGDVAAFVGIPFSAIHGFNPKPKLVLLEFGLKLHKYAGLYCTYR